MHTLHIRKLPSHIYRALKKAADREGRSLDQQVIITLAKGLDIPLDFKKRRKKILDEIEKESSFFQKWGHVDVALWVRQDRSDSK